MRMQCNQIRNTTHNKGKNGKYNRIEYKRIRANYEKRLPALNSALKILQELATLDLVFFWPSSSVINIICHFHYICLESKQIQHQF